jgi:hypothetical protein
MTVPPQVLDRTALPAKSVHRFGLRSVASLDTQPNGHWMFGNRWQESCGTNVLVAPDNCDPAIDTTEERTKTPFTEDLESFTEQATLYGYHRCSVIGSDIAERSAIARAELDLGQWHKIEALLMDSLASTADEPYAAGISGAKNALAALLMNWDLPVQPVVHMTPNVAVMLDGQFEQEGDSLTLKVSGAPVSIGFGYDTGLANAGVGHLALTGPVFITQGDYIENEQIDPATNEYLALAERPYSVGYLCKAVYVQVNAVGALTA